MKENGEHLISISCVLRVICISQSNGKSNQMQFAHNCRKFWVCVSVLVCVCVYVCHNLWQLNLIEIAFDRNNNRKADKKETKYESIDCALKRQALYAIMYRNVCIYIVSIVSSNFH